MKLFLSLLLSVLLFLPAWGFREQKPYLAVFCNPGYEIFWPSLNVDCLYLAMDWEHFDDFLRKVKKEAGGRPIELDIECHGDKALLLQYPDARTGEMVTKSTTMGYVINHIERYLGRERVTLIMECCYAGSVYKTTIRQNKEGENCNHIPQFPVYGNSFNHMNLNNLVYIQYKTRCHRYFEDLRAFELKAGPKDMDRNENSEDHKRMATLYRILASLYDPEK